MDEKQRQWSAWAGGITIGIGIGVAIGIATDNLGVWIAIGVAIGIAFAGAFGASATRKKKDEPGSDGGGAA